MNRNFKLSDSNSSDTSSRKRDKSKSSKKKKLEKKERTPFTVACGQHLESLARPDPKKVLNTFDQHLNHLDAIQTENFLKNLYWEYKSPVHALKCRVKSNRKLKIRKSSLTKNRWDLKSRKHHEEINSVPRGLQEVADSILFDISDLLDVHPPKTDRKSTDIMEKFLYDASNKSAIWMKKIIDASMLTKDDDLYDIVPNNDAIVNMVCSTPSTEQDDEESSKSKKKNIHWIPINSTERDDSSSKPADDTVIKVTSTLIGEVAQDVCCDSKILDNLQTYQKLFEELGEKLKDNSKCQSKDQKTSIKNVSDFIYLLDESENNTSGEFKKIAENLPEVAALANVFDDLLNLSGEFVDLLNDYKNSSAMVDEQPGLTSTPYRPKPQIPDDDEKEKEKETEKEQDKESQENRDSPVSIDLEEPEIVEVTQKKSQERQPSPRVSPKPSSNVQVIEIDDYDANISELYDSINNVSGQFNDVLEAYKLSGEEKLNEIHGDIQELAEDFENVVKLSEVLTKTLNASLEKSMMAPGDKSRMLETVRDSIKLAVEKSPKKNKSKRMRPVTAPRKSPEKVQNFSDLLDDKQDSDLSEQFDEMFKNVSAKDSLALKFDEIRHQSLNENAGRAKAKTPDKWQYLSVGNYDERAQDPDVVPIKIQSGNQTNVLGVRSLSVNDLKKQFEQQRSSDSVKLAVKGYSTGDKDKIVTMKKVSVDKLKDFFEKNTRQLEELSKSIETISRTNRYRKTYLVGHALNPRAELTILVNDVPINNDTYLTAHYVDGRTKTVPLLSPHHQNLFR